MSDERSYRVREERPGVEWTPKGGDFLVLSHQTDNTLGGDELADATERDPAEAKFGSYLGGVALDLLLRHATEPGFAGIEDSLSTMCRPERISELAETLSAHAGVVDRKTLRQWVEEQPGPISVRDTAVHFHASKMAAQLALRQLVAEGLLDDRSAEPDEFLRRDS